MAYRPELLVTAGNAFEVKRLLCAGANAVLVGEQQYGLRLPGDMTLSDIEKTMEVVRDYKAKLYVAVNQIMHNEHIVGLADYLQRLEQMGVDAIVFGDPAVLLIAKEITNLKLHWNAEMTSTNYRTASYWQRRGSNRFVVARELNMEQIIEAKQQLPDMEVQVQVHGMTNIYHSKRHLLQHYFHHLRKEEQRSGFGLERKLFLIEQERPHEKFPLYEDANGTHIMSSDDVCILEDVKGLLDARIDSFKIEGLLKPVSYNEVVVQVYREAIDAYVANSTHYQWKEAWLERIRAVQDVERELSFGFFYKEQMY